jgi:4-aminobutyrate aminotransferase-like enzyme
VEDRASKKPLAARVTEAIFQECLKKGLLAMNYAPQFRINPPLSLTRAEAEEGVAILDEVFAYVLEQVPYH